jgi:hypothetical protein
MPLRGKAPLKAIALIVGVTAGIALIAAVVGTIIVAIDVR